MKPLPREIPDEYWLVEGRITLVLFLKAVAAIFESGSFSFLFVRTYSDNKFTPKLKSLAVHVFEDKSSLGLNEFGKIYEILGTEDHLAVLLDFAKQDATPAICDNVFVKNNKEYCVMWWDAGCSSVYLSAAMSEELIKKFADICNCNYAFHDNNKIIRKV